MARWSIRKPPDALGDPEEPIVAELFSAERLEQHAESLAAAQTVTDEPSRGRPILPRLADNGRFLLESYRTLAVSIREERSITPAAEWLVDNFHIVEEQLREIRDDLPDTLLPGAPQARRRPPRGLPARAWPRMGLRRAHGQPLRPGDPAQDGGRLPAGRATDDRRAVGDRDQPADHPRREPPALRPRGSCGAARPATWPMASRTACWASGPTDRATRRGSCRGSRMPRSRTPPWCSSSSGCVTRIRPRPRPSGGSRSASPPTGRRPRRPSAASTSARRR